MEISNVNFSTFIRHLKTDDVWREFDRHTCIAVFFYDDF
jgi:hypothetical protein